MPIFRKWPILSKILGRPVYVIGYKIHHQNNGETDKKIGTRRKLTLLYVIGYKMEDNWNIFVFKTTYNLGSR